MRGLRIDLCDIESTIILSAQGRLRDAVVTLRNGDPDFLVAHVVFASQQEVSDPPDVLEPLLSQLPMPQYMAPVAAISMDELPSTIHSKIDRNAVKELPLQRNARKSDHYAADLTQTMARLRDIWQEVVGAKETAVPQIPAFLEAVNPVLKDCSPLAKTVLVSGGTGFLARRLLPLLIESPRVAAIHCVAVRGKHFDDVQSPPPYSKTTWHRGDLTSNQLGLEPEEFRYFAGQVDVIIHLGANCSIWDDYHTLRASNVQPTKELVKLAALRRIPIHFVSTVSAANHAGSAAASINATLHASPIEGANGYVTTKWASERILARAANSLGVPFTVHRFLPPEEDCPAPERLL